MWMLCPSCNSRYHTDSGRCPLDGAALAETPDPMLGRVVGGRYRILSMLGEGGMGAVYRASHLVVQREVAIKLLHPRFSDDPVLRKRFRGEAEVTNLLRHDNIVDISDCGFDGQALYLVMELLHGETVDDHLRRAPIPVREAVQIVIDVARALGRAHELRVIHRDIKPANVFLCDQAPRVKVMDFGIAHTHRDKRLTITGQIFGTPEYMSPEQCQGDLCGPASDLYSLGVFLFEVLTGRLPFEGKNVALRLQHVRTAPPRLRSLDPAFPPLLDEVIDRLLSKSPGARHRDAYHLIDDLARVLELLPTPPVRSSRRVAAPTLQQPASTYGLEAWQRRRDQIRAAVMAAGDRPIPAVVGGLLRSLDQALSRAPEMEAEVAALVAELNTQEQENEARRQRFVVALDALTRDESAMAREAAALERALAARREAASEAHAELTRAWAEVARRVGDAPAIEYGAAQEIASMAELATSWCAAEEARRTCDARCERDEAARRDLADQIDQFRGRLAASGVDAERRALELRARMAELGSRLASQHEACALLVDELTRHLGDLPGLIHAAE